MEGLEAITAITLALRWTVCLATGAPSVLAVAKPRSPRRLLVSNLVMRDGHPWRGS